MSVNFQSKSIDRSGSRKEFTRNWAGGAGDNRSIRRRLMAVLRMAHMALGMGRKRLGLGSLGIGRAIAAALAALGIESPQSVAGMVAEDGAIPRCAGCGRPIMILTTAQRQSAFARARVAKVNRQGAVAAALFGALALTVVFSNTVYAATVSVSSNPPPGATAGTGCGPSGAAASGTGPDGTAYTSTPQVDGNGNWSIVGGCSANGGGLGGLGVTVYGAYSQAMGEFATAAGFGSKAGLRATAIGVQSEATGQSSVAMGYNATADNLGAVAVGSDANAASSNAIAVGNHAQVLNPGNVSTTALDVRTDGLGVPTGAQPQLWSSAIGDNTTASVGALAVGSNAKAESLGSTAIGQGSVSTGAVSMAVGFSSYATGEVSQAIGYQSVSAGDLSTAIGTTATSTGDGAVAIGASAAATGDRALAFGSTPTLSYNQDSTTNTRATGVDSLAFGTSAAALESNAIAMGTGSVADSVDAIAIGTGANATGGKAVSIGAGNVANGDGAVAIGDPSTATGTGAVAQGSNNTATGNGTLAIGSSNLAGAGDQAVGSAGTPANGAVALGQNNKAFGQGSLAIGNGNVTSGQGAIALGNTSQATSAGAVALGDAAQATANGAVAFGGGTLSSGDNSVAIGAGSLSSGAQGVAIGSGANSGAFDGAVAIGENAVTNNDGDVALGSGSVTAAAVGTTDIDINGTTYTFAGTTPASTVSVGAVGAERTITNVAAGRISGTSTDAINGSQLFATNQAVNEIGTQVGEVNDRAVKYDGALGDPKDTITLEGAAGTTITNVAPGALSATSTDAVNGSQLFATNQQVDQNTTDITNLGDTITNIAGDTSTTYVGANGSGIRYVRTNETGLTASDSSAQGQGSTAVGYDATAVGVGALALGQNALANEDGSVALGAGSVTAAAVGTTDININGTTYTFAGTTPTSTVSVGDVGTERTITNVAAGRISGTSTDAINGSQLFATNQAVDEIGTQVGEVNDRAVKYDGALGDPKDTITLEGAAGTKITNLAAGDVSATSTDAVNGSQLFATNQQVDQNTTDITNLGDTITNIAGDTSTTYTDASGVGIRYVRTNEAGLPQSDSSAQGQGSTAVGYDATAVGVSSLALGRNAQADVLGGVALGAGSVADRAIAPLTGTLPAGSAVITYNTTDQELLGAVSVGRDGAYRQITNVADGTDAQDAVTIRQLQGAIASVGVTATQYFHANSSAPDSLAVGTDSIAVGPSTVVNGDNGIGMGNGSIVDATAPGGTAIGQNAHVMMADGIALGTSSQAGGEQSIAIGAGAVADHYLGVALGSGSMTAAAVGTSEIVINGQTYAFAGATPESVVSIGAVGAERQLINVAAGRVTADSTDAINGSQLFATNQAVEAIDDDVAELDDRAVKYDGALGDPKDTITLEGTNGTTITNLAAGAVNATSTDAVNGSQLHGVSNSIANHLGGGATVNPDGTVNGPTYAIQGGNYTTVYDTFAAVDTNLTNLNNTITDINNGGGIKYFHANSAAADSQAIGQESVAVGPQAVANADNSVAMGNGATTVTGADGAVALGQGATANNAGDVALGSGSTTQAVVNTSGTTINGTDYAFAGTNATSTVSVGGVGTERTITNVAAGQITADSTDAINGSQLYATNQAIDNLASGIGELADGAVLYDKNPDGSRANSVTLIGGDPSAPVLISNVAAGVANNDAVNVGQLKEGLSTTLVEANSYTDNQVAYAIDTANTYTDQVGATTLNQANNYTDYKFGQLNQEVGEIRNEARQAAAIGLAAASLRYDDRPGKASVAVGGGLWRGEGAFAFGAGYTSEEGRVRANLSATTAGGKWGGGAGISFTLN